MNLSAALVNGLLLSVLLAGSVWLALRLIPRRALGADTRYVIWWIALACCVALPALFLAGRPTTPEHHTESGGGLTIAVLDLGPSPAPSPAKFQLPVAVPLRPWMLWAPVLWAASSALMLGRLLLSHFAVLRACSRARELLPQSNTRLEAWRQAAGPRRHAVRVFESADVPIPFAAGPFRRAIVLPSHLVGQLSLPDMDRIALHEAAHLARLDDWAILGEQVLIQYKIPFQIIFDRHLPELRNYKVLFLADQECLSDGDLEHIQAFVENGGGVVATGATGGFDQWRRRRRRNGLEAALGLRAGQAARGRLGKGRYVYLPAIIPSPVPGSPGSCSSAHEELVVPRFYYDFSPDCWLLPRNAAEIVEALRWAADGRFSAEIQAPLSVVAEVTRSVRNALDNLTMVHLLNYDSRQAVRDIQVDLAVPSRVRSITIFSPDDESRRPVEYKQEGGRARFKVERLGTYSLAVVELAGR